MTYNDLIHWSTLALIREATNYAGPNSNYDFDMWGRSDLIEFILDNIRRFN